MKNSQRGEIATIITLGTLLVLGVSTLVSSVILNNGNKKNTTSTKASESCFRINADFNARDAEGGKKAFYANVTFQSQKSGKINLSYNGIMVAGPSELSEGRYTYDPQWTQPYGHDSDIAVMTVGEGDFPFTYTGWMESCEPQAQTLNCTLGVKGGQSYVSGAGCTLNGQTSSAPPAAPPAQTSGSANASCDDANWSCLGECANAGVRLIFGGDSARWRAEKIKNTQGATSCDQTSTAQSPSSGSTNKVYVGVSGKTFVCAYSEANGKCYGGEAKDKSKPVGFNQNCVWMTDFSEEVNCNPKDSAKPVTVPSTITTTTESKVVAQPSTDDSVPRTPPNVPPALVKANDKVQFCSLGIDSLGVEVFLAPGKASCDGNGLLNICDINGNLTSENCQQKKQICQLTTVDEKTTSGKCVSSDLGSCIQIPCPVSNKTYSKLGNSYYDNEGCNGNPMDAFNANYVETSCKVNAIVSEGLGTGSTKAVAFGVKCSPVGFQDCTIGNQYNECQSDGNWQLVSCPKNTICKNNDAKKDVCVPANDFTEVTNNIMNTKGEATIFIPFSDGTESYNGVTYYDYYFKGLSSDEIKQDIFNYFKIKQSGCWFNCELAPDINKSKIDSSGITYVYTNVDRYNESYGNLTPKNYSLEIKPLGQLGYKKSDIKFDGFYKYTFDDKGQPVSIGKAISIVNIPLTKLQNVDYFLKGNIVGFPSNSMRFKNIEGQYVSVYSANSFDLQVDNPSLVLLFNRLKYTSSDFFININYKCAIGANNYDITKKISGRLNGPIVNMDPVILNCR